jgi:hypothetical protein
MMPLVVVFLMLLSLRQAVALIKMRLLLAPIVALGKSLMESVILISCYFPLL